MTPEEITEAVRETLLHFTHTCSRDGHVRSDAFVALAAQTLAAIRAMGGKEHFDEVVPGIIEYAAHQQDFNASEGDAS